MLIIYHWSEIKSPPCGACRDFNDRNYSWIEFIHELLLYEYMHVEYKYIMNTCYLAINCMYILSTGRQGRIQLFCNWPTQYNYMQ